MIGPEHEQPHEGTGDFEDAVLIELSDLERGAFGLVRLARIPGAPSVAVVALLFVDGVLVAEQVETFREHDVEGWDRALAGGVQEDSWEAACQFDALKAFSVREHEPTKASRPFDKHRDGLIPSAGSGLLVLEELEHAQRRGARIYAELIGYAFTSDGYDMTIPSGEGSVRCMRLALEAAGIRPDEVDYINAHATSTPLGDVSEARAIAEVFGKRPYVSSTKSMTGHELGACGSNELIYTLLMMRDQFIAPSINLDELDPKCDGINLVANHAIDAKIDVVASNAFGFGGVNTCVILRRHAA